MGVESFWFLAKCSAQFSTYTVLVNHGSKFDPERHHSLLALAVAHFGSRTQILFSSSSYEPQTKLLLLLLL